MPPWPDHHPSRPTANLNPHAYSSSIPPLHYHSQSPEHRAPTTGFVTEPFAAASSLAAPPTTHSRSSSNPFPSSHGTGTSSRKSEKKRGDIYTQHTHQASDDEFGLGHSSGRNRTGAGTGTSSSTTAMPFLGSKDSAQTEGTCMTCASVVRWPRNLKVFRCTTCVTINDLVVAPPSATDGKTDGKAHARSSSQESSRVSSSATRQMVDRCVNSYLRDRLRRVQRPSEPPTRAPPPPVPGSPHLDARGRQENGSGAYNMPMRPRTAQNDSGQASYRHRDIPSSSQPNTLHLQKSTGHLRPANSHDARQPAASNEPVDYRHIFRPLEDYIISSFTTCDILNNSFLPMRTPMNMQTASEGDRPESFPLETDAPPERQGEGSPEINAKTPLSGEVAENGSWWSGNRRGITKKLTGRDKSPESSHKVSQKTPRIEWEALARWYRSVINAGESWSEQWMQMRPRRQGGQDAFDAETYMWESIEFASIEQDIADSQYRLQRTLLKATENLLKRPRRPLKRPEDCRFLLILLANPLLYTVDTRSSNDVRSAMASQRPGHSARQKTEDSPAVAGASHHSGIIKRILGLLSNMPDECHRYFVSWFSRFSEGHFQRTVDLIGRFVSYRMSRHQQNQKKESSMRKAADHDLVPTLTTSRTGASATTQIHAAISGHPMSRKNDPQAKPTGYSTDWQVKAAARVMSLLFSANENHHAIKRDATTIHQGPHSAGLTARNRAHAHGQMLPISAFYNTLLDYFNIPADFETWESKTSKFTFCQYPFFLSIWAKIHLMEHDARRQMESRAREAFFKSILTRNPESQYLSLKVRRDCLVEDSLSGVSSVVGAGGAGHQNIKKGLKIEFVGEEGVDAGGLRKEWFLLLVREVFDPQHGLFLYDEESQFCYFNPFCFESTEQFFLVGVLLGLAIYNSTILDVALPPFAFQKLLAAAPSSNAPTTTSPRLTHKWTLEDLAEFRPSLARGLRQLLEFDGDVEETFCRDFVAEMDRYGEIVQVPLCPGGESKPVTNANRREFVDLYIHYLLDTAVARQFEPFKRGFFIVCGGNALSLFRPEEIELLVRGSDEPLDIASLRAVSVYENWPARTNPHTEPVINWFWEFFERIAPKDQRRVLSFITGSDRIPAMGATNLIIKVQLVGEDGARFPTARTCFNSVGLYRYRTREVLEEKLWRAVSESEGFGLK